jgi:hypothetical protein
MSTSDYVIGQEIVTLVGEGERTRLSVAERGLDPLPWPEADKRSYADEHNGGWADFLGRLARLLGDRA